MIIHVLFVIVCFLIDGILMVLFPNDTALSDLVFVSNLGFCALVLTIRKFSLTDSCLFAACFGMLYDHYFANTLFIYAIAFFCSAFVVHFWSKHMTDTVLESLILCISTIFANAILVLILISLLRVKEDYIEKKERQVRKEEKVEWFRLRSKR